MPIQLRPRLKCHSCGSRSKFSKKEGRRFQCEYCQAVNYFDENGEVADVPVEETAPPRAFATSTNTRDPLVDEFSAENSVFCATCLKNQHLYTQTLSEFLPDPDDPDYDQIEAQLPSFKKGLEERFPQCCAKCEPKVRAQLMKATYNAKSDHVRRVLIKSRQRMIASRWGWRSLLVGAAGAGYAVSLGTQVAWHAYGSQIQPSLDVDGMKLSQCLSRRPLNEQCLNLMERFVGLSLGLGLLCVWWNPKWQHKLSNNDGKLGGLEKYYLTQLGLLLSRLTVWAILQHVPLNIRTTNVIHALFAIFITAVALWSNFKIIQVRLTKPIDWNADPAPLLSSRQFVPPESDDQSQPTPTQERSFGLQNLATATTQSYEAWRAPTPPDDSAEAMDWTPSQPVFQPQPKKIHYLTGGPSPFHGKLPVVPARGVQTQSGHLPHAPKDAIGLPPGYFDRTPGSILPPREPRVSDDAILQPTFFGHDSQADTGLEDIFETVFSFQDRAVAPPAETTRSSIPSGSQYNVQGHQAASRAGTTPQKVCFQTIISGVAFFTLLVALISWLLEIALKPQGSSFGYYVVLTSASIPTIHFVGDILTGRVHGHPLWLVIFTIEATALVGLILIRDMLEGGFIDLWNKLAIAGVALLLPQEFVRMSSSSGASGSRSPHTKPSPSTESSHRHGASTLMVDRDINNAQAASTPKSRKTLSRQDSDESSDNMSSATSSSFTKDWDTPNVRSDRYQWEPPENSNRSATRSSKKTMARNGPTGVMNGFVGLSLDGDASRNHDGNTGSLFGNARSSSSRLFDTQYRERRGF
ncbi:hypothetical protein LTR84_001457 [Exophiala bonariae]|uniref:Ima1 N-terminal domain-containing protein n=1 Tax=Exophiala bonariae TaxID=1690606 RepID=A0AAV9NGD7_9EURO|nr:hypothetical protein LTR84_001457 [Exophiala bonariae]